MLPPFLGLLARPRSYNPYYHVATSNLTSRVPVCTQYIDRAIIPFKNLASKCSESTFDESHHCYLLFVASIKYLDRAVSLRRGYTIRCFRKYFDERDMLPALIRHLCKHGCANLLREMDWKHEFTSSVYAHEGLCNACKSGDIVMAKLLADKFALISVELNTTNMDAEIIAAKERCHAAVVKGACMNGHLDTAKWFAENFRISHEYMRDNRIEIIEKTLSEGFLDVTRWLIIMCQLNDAEKEMCEQRIRIKELRAAISEEETSVGAFNTRPIKGFAVSVAAFAAIIGTLTAIVILT